MFGEIIGHEQIIEHLQNALSMEKISHAYILNGPKESGKMMIAEAFAMALLCENNVNEACGTCRSCMQAKGHNQPDIIYVSHENPNIIGVDDIREQINNSIVIKPYSSKYKVYIVEDADKMNTAAQNALLKTIEEPPAYAVILLLAANANKFLQTIRSRCITLNLKTVRDEKIRDFLMKEHQVTDYQADVCVAFAQGNVGKALQLSASEDFREMKSSVMTLVKRISDYHLYELSEPIKTVGEYKDSIEDYLDLLLIWYKDVLLYKSTGNANGLVFKDEVFDIKKQAQMHSYHGLQEIFDAIDLARTRINANVNFDLVIELLLIAIKEN